MVKFFDYISSIGLPLLMPFIISLNVQSYGITKDLPHFFNKKYLQEEISIPKDSGLVKDSLKDGKWVEYEIDKGNLTPELKKMVNQQGLDINDFVPLRKVVGNYAMGKKEGLWVMYKSDRSAPPFKWRIEKETNYKKGLKNGKEVVYSNMSGAKSAILMERTWVNNVENGIGKIYDLNPPYHLQKVYKAINGKYLLMETYHINGELETKFVDTILNKAPIKHFKHYYKTGTLKQIGFYERDTIPSGVWINYYENGNKQSLESYENGVIHGNYEYYHENGQLWTKTIYKNGLLWEIISNFDKDGNKKNKGSLKGGTGTVNIYDENGTLSREVVYNKGIQQK